MASTGDPHPSPTVGERAERGLLKARARFQVFEYGKGLGFEGYRTHRARHGVNVEGGKATSLNILQ